VTRLLHRYCPDHSPDRALCGVDVSGVEEIDPDTFDPDTAELCTWCVVCADLAEIACEDACLGADREAKA